MAAYTLDSLIGDLKRNTYTPKTEQELQGIADRRYQSYYDQQRLGANQAAETTDLALDRQLTSLNKAYTKQSENSAQQYQQAYSQAGRGMLSRGMQRSSYGAATLGNIAVAGNKAQQDIADNQQTAAGQVGDQRTLLARQLADQLRQYSASQAADTLSYIDELESKEYERGTQSDQYNNGLAAQIYQFANQQEQQTREQQNWTAQFNENVRQFNTTQAGKGGTGGGNTGGNTGANTGGNTGATALQELQRKVEWESAMRKVSEAMATAGSIKGTNADELSTGKVTIKPADAIKANPKNKTLSYNR